MCAEKYYLYTHALHFKKKYFKMFREKPLFLTQMTYHEGWRSMKIKI